MKGTLDLSAVVRALGTLTLAALSSGCGGCYRTVSRERSRESNAGLLDSARFEHGPQIVPLLRRSFETRVRAMGANSWPSSFRRDQAAWPRTLVVGGLIFDDFNDVTVTSRAVDFHGQRYFFFSKGRPRPPAIGGRWDGPERNRAHTLVYIPEIGDSDQVVLLPEVRCGPFDERLEFDVVARDDAIVLIYAAVDGVYRMFGRSQDQGLTFSQPERLHPGGRGARRLQLARAGSELHLLWAQQDGTLAFDSTLLYMRQADPSTGWGKAAPVSKTAIHLTPTLLVENKDVYICWADHRFRSRVWTRQNDAKAFIQKSTNGGVTFRAPVLLSKRDDANERPAQVLLVPREESLLILWRHELEPLDGGDWQAFSLDRDLRVLRDYGSITSERLRAAYAYRMGGIAGDPARRTHKFPAG